MFVLPKRLLLQTLCGREMVIICRSLSGILRNGSKEPITAKIVDVDDFDIPNFESHFFSLRPAYRSLLI